MCKLSDILIHKQDLCLHIPIPACRLRNPPLVTMATTAEIRAQLGNVFSTGVESPPVNMNGDQDDITPFPSPAMGKLSCEWHAVLLV